MENQNIPVIVVFLAFLAIFVFGCSQSPEKQTAVEKAQEEITDTGILSVKTTPSSAKVYVDGELKGETPLTLYNIPVGTYSLLIKKDGYNDFEKTANVKVGKTEEVEAELIPASPVQKKSGEATPSAEKPVENAPSSSPKLNIVNMSKSFIIYYDFERELFTEVTSGNPDVFSSNYNTYIYFTAMPPAKMLLLNKPIKDAKKEDCIKADDTIANLNSGQTLCIKTTKGKYAAIGGNWKDSPTELEWVLFS